MKIVCIGRNYLEHAKELGNEVPTTPLIFIKPDSAVLRNNDDFYNPAFSNDIHYEVELIIKINKVGKNIQAKFANKYYDEIALGIDFTARDIQSECKAKGLPWERAKAFDHSAVTSKFLSKKDYDLNQLNFSLTKNGEKVQDGNTSLMIFNVDQIIENISQFLTLKKGDLIFTGTPEGVGKIEIGDQLEGFIEDKKMFSFNIK